MFRLSKVLALALVALAAVPPLASAAVPDSGVLITRQSNQKWDVRLVSGATAQQFSGVVESTLNIASTYPTRLEAGDVATLATPTTLAMQFSATPGTFDAISFWVGPTTQLCLRDTGGSGVKFYLGATLATAVEVTAPVALLGEDPCHTAPPRGPYQTTRKFHPGHYIALLRVQTAQSTLIDSATKPGVTGVLKRYTWRQLEPTAGTYDFTQLQSDLVVAQSYGFHLIAMIEDKTFTLERPTPPYLNAYTVLNSGGGYTVKRWDPYVVTRWKALVQALGRFDSNPAFEGIATQETALSIDLAPLTALGYTPEKMRDAYIDMLDSALVSLPTSRVFWYQNYFAGNQAYIATIAKAVGPKGVVMSGPDVLPDSQPLLINSYPYFSQYKGQMHMAIQVEDICYNALHVTTGYPTKYWTPLEDFTFARDTLNVNYMFWVRIPASNPADSYNWTHALPVIGANPVLNP